MKDNILPICVMIFIKYLVKSNISIWSQTQIILKIFLNLKVNLLDGFI